MKRQRPEVTYSGLFLLLGISAVTEAIPWGGPAPTSSYNAADLGPLPTAASGHVTDLLRRQGSQNRICGWIGGNSNSPMICAWDSNCIFDEANKVVGCCPVSGPCTSAIYTDCIDANRPQTDLKPNVYTCPGQQVCYRDTYPGGYSQYGCGASSDATTVATTYTGQLENAILSVIHTSIDLQSSITSSSSDSGPIALISSSQTTPLSASQTRVSTVPTVSGNLAQHVPSNSAPTTVDTSTLSSPATGPVIAGAAIGALVGLSVIAILIAFCIRQRRRERERVQELQRQSQMLAKEATLFGSIHRSSTSVSVNRREEAGSEESQPFSPDDIVSPRSPVFPNAGYYIPGRESLEELNLQAESNLIPPKPTWTEPPPVPPRSPLRAGRKRQSMQPVGLSRHSSMRRAASNKKQLVFQNEDHTGNEAESGDEGEQYDGYTAGEIGGLRRWASLSRKKYAKQRLSRNPRVRRVSFDPIFLAATAGDTINFDKPSRQPSIREEIPRFPEADECAVEPLRLSTGPKEVPIVKQPVPGVKGLTRIYTP